MTRVNIYLKNEFDKIFFEKFSFLKNINLPKFCKNLLYIKLNKARLSFLALQRKQKSLDFQNLRRLLRPVDHFRPFAFPRFRYDDLFENYPRKHVADELVAQVEDGQIFGFGQEHFDVEKLRLLSTNDKVQTLPETIVVLQTWNHIL